VREKQHELEDRKMHKGFRVDNVMVDLPQPTHAKTIALENCFLTTTVT